MSPKVIRGSLVMNPNTPNGNIHDFLQTPRPNKSYNLNEHVLIRLFRSVRNGRFKLQEIYAMARHWQKHQSKQLYRIAN